MSSRSCRVKAASGVLPSQKTKKITQPSNVGILLRRPKTPKRTLDLSQLADESGSSISSSKFPSGIDLVRSGKESSRSLKQQSPPQNKKSIPKLSQSQDMKEESIVRPLYPRGPGFFPPGRPLHIMENNVDDLPDEIHLDNKAGCDFTFNDFQLTPKNRLLQQSKGTISRQNYLKLTSWFSRHVPVQENLRSVVLETTCQHPPCRVPKQQILLELQAMVSRILEDTLESEISSSPTLEEERPQWPPPGPDDSMFRSATSRFFCGERRSNSPFDSRHQPLISPSEVAILESMMNGGIYLSLKAHFLTELPTLSPLVYTLTSLNLSFNSLKTFPSELSQLQSLIFLSMRNNPLKEIPNDIGNLKNLHVLCVSFCILSDLPTGLFDLTSLMDLDVSYNNLHVISRDLCKLTNLHRLNVEGNQLVGLPSTTLSLSLSHIVLGSNLMHPLLWRENTRNQPQALVDLCCVLIQRNFSDTSPHFPATVLDSQRSSVVCEECHQSIFGYGLRVIRGVKHKHFHVKNLPFIFNVCSPTCSYKLRRKHASHWLT